MLKQNYKKHVEKGCFYKNKLGMKKKDIAKLKSKRIYLENEEDEDDDEDENSHEEIPLRDVHFLQLKRYLEKTYLE